MAAQAAGTHPSLPLPVGDSNTAVAPSLLTFQTPCREKCLCLERDPKDVRPNVHNASLSPGGWIYAFNGYVYELF